jgi:hypothetical protein
MEENRLIGIVQWKGYNYIDGKSSIHKVFGVVQTIEKKDYFFHGSNFLSFRRGIEEYDLMTFEGVQRGEKLNAIKCRVYHKIGDFYIGDFLDNIQYEPVNIQENLLKQLSDFIIQRSKKTKTEILNDSFYSYRNKKTVYYKKSVEKQYIEIDDSFYEKIKTIAQSGNVSSNAKDNFLARIYRIADEKCQYKILYEDRLVDIQAKIPEEQFEILKIYLHQLGNSIGYDKIKSIIQTFTIDETVKTDFIKLVFKKVNRDTKYKILFEDCLIDINVKTAEEQTELLKQFIPSWDFNYTTINLIVNSNKITNQVKTNFLNYAFSEAKREDKYKMLFEYGLLDISRETTEIQLEQLRKIINRDGYYSGWYGIEWNINKFSTIIESDKISETAKALFFKTTYKEACSDFQHKMLFLLDDRMSELTGIEYKEKLKNISKIDLLHLWLKGINPHYNYLEFVQVAWQLSNDERKLFNKRVKEYAKNKQLQHFIDQIPKAELLDENNDFKIYKCKWRNLHYKNGYIQLFLDKYTATEDYLWESARKEWNLLTREYFNNRRMEDIMVKVDKHNCIIEIKGLDDIEAKIVMAEIRKNGTSERRTEISSSQITKIIHNVAARNQCIDFLSKQNSQYNAIDIQEFVTEQYGTIRRDISFLFPIPDGQGNVYLIWESAEFEKSKATHIFKCREDVISEMEERIKNFIESNYRTRSRLNSVETEDREAKQELQYYGRVNHDSAEYKVWEDRMKSEMFFLK